MPSHGTLTLNVDGTFSYTHDESENFGDNFICEVSGVNNATAQTTVDITVNPADDNAPVVIANNYTVAEGSTLTVSDADETSVPSDANDDSVLVNVPSDHNGAFTFNASGNFTYAHSGSEASTCSFIYKANDGVADSNVVTVTVNIAPVNDHPQLSANGGLTVDANTTGIITSSDLQVTDNDNIPDQITYFEGYHFCVDLLRNCDTIVLFPAMLLCTLSWKPGVIDENFVLMFLLCVPDV